MISDYLPVILGAVVVIALIAMLARDSRAGDIDIPAPAQLRTDLLFGYYGSVRTRDGVSQVEETKDHVNLHWENVWSGRDIALRDMKLAQAAGMKIIVAVSDELFRRVSPTQIVIRDDAEQALTEFCRWLVDAGLAPAIRSLFVLDEPDIGSNNACGLMPQAAEIVRRVISGIPDLADKRLAINYTHDFCHKHLFDDIMFDRYDERSGIFKSGGMYDKLVDGLLPHQQTFLIPGGYSDCRQNPEPFLNFAHSRPEVAGIVAFLRRDPHGNGFEGIADDPEMNALYIAAGKSIVGG